MASAAHGAACSSRSGNLRHGHCLAAAARQWHEIRGRRILALARLSWCGRWANLLSTPEAIMALRSLALVLAGLLLALPAAAEDAAKDFSGPQKGEAITPFNVRGVLGDKA